MGSLNRWNLDNQFLQCLSYLDSVIFWNSIFNSHLWGSAGETLPRELKLERVRGSQEANVFPGGWVGWGGASPESGMGSPFSNSNSAVWVHGHGNCRDAFERVSGPCSLPPTVQTFQSHWNPHLDTFPQTCCPPWQQLQTYLKTSIVTCDPRPKTQLCRGGCNHSLKQGSLPAWKVSLALPLFRVSFGCK